jgi:hypothetical protein
MASMRSQTECGIKKKRRKEEERRRTLLPGLFE